MHRFITRNCSPTTSQHVKEIVCITIGAVGGLTVVTGVYALNDYMASRDHVSASLDAKN